MPTFALKAPATTVTVKIVGDCEQADIDDLYALWEWCLIDTSTLSTTSAHDDPGRDTVTVTYDPSAPWATWGDDWVVAPDWGQIQQHLARMIAISAHEHARHDGFAFHASGLAHPATGATAIFVGSTEAGKTTVARRYGSTYAYVCDEMMAVNVRSLAVHAFGKPLSIRDAAGESTLFSPSSVGMRRPEGPLHVAALCLLDRSAGAPEKPLLEPVDLFDALECILPQTGYGLDRPQPLQQLSSLITAVGGVRRLRYRDDADLTSALTTLIGALP